MVPDDLGKRLHNKATRGDPISGAEQAELESWYALQDEAEGDVLASSDIDEEAAALRTQVDEALAQLTATASRIGQTCRQNESLRHELAVLRRQLASHST